MTKLVAAVLGLLAVGTLAGCGPQGGSAPHDGAAPQGSTRTFDEATVLQVELAVREAEQAVRDVDRQLAGD